MPYNRLVKWSIRLGTFSGIAVYMHLTFLLLLGWVGYVNWTKSRSVTATLGAIAFILIIFLCVVLHEFGHALMARRFGIRTLDITLLPIGGLARLERMPDNPMHELLVALAGPAVNVVLAGILFGWLMFTGVLATLGQVPWSMVGGGLFSLLLVVNLYLAVFNLIPAFPMDGGRVLRALLATHMEYSRATKIAATTGQGIAFVFGVLGLFVFGSPVLVFIALFVWLGAAQESSMVQMKTALSGIPVRRAMLTDFRTLSPTDSLGDVIQRTLDSSQKDFAVVQDGAVVGILTQSDLLAALTKGGSTTPVGDVMQRDFVVVDAHEMLESALARFRECSCKTLPVVHDGQLVGMVTIDNVGEFLAIQGALDRVRPPRRQT